MIYESRGRRFGAKDIMLILPGIFCCFAYPDYIIYQEPDQILCYSSSLWRIALEDHGIS